MRHPRRHAPSGRVYRAGRPFPRPDEEFDGPDEPAEPRTIVDLVDVDDPAFGHILRAALDLEEYGFDIADMDIARRAVAAGQRRHANSPEVHQREQEEVKERRKANPFEIAAGEVVYYMRIGNRVKIGWSTNLPSRLCDINPEELMVTEPGNRILERVRHDQFAELRSHGEWFRLEDRLSAHIEELRRAEARAS